MTPGARQADPAGATAATVTAPLQSSVRLAGPEGLQAALLEGRVRTLALFEGLSEALGPEGLRIAFDPVLNLPLWELGHLGWFEERWLARNPERARGSACDPDRPRAASLLPQADALYDSAAIAHALRWQLELPGAPATHDYLARVRERTLGLLATGAADDDAMYFFRLVSLHEAMHVEAWHYMAQHLGVACSALCATGPGPSSLQGEWAVPAGRHRLGSAGPGFAFDNELVAHDVDLPAFRIDRAAVTWQRFLPFVEDGGYDEPRWWTADGWAWRQSSRHGQPHHLRHLDGEWQQSRFGVWQRIVHGEPALHLSLHEAAAWCRWSGRRLPTEAEWERAATLAPAVGQGFDWGQVWEWTASDFAPYPGFVPHPYREYSQPWFDGRPVLRGASFATGAGIRHPTYRNFFTADRTDVFAGFRSCALGDARPSPGGVGAQQSEGF